LKVKRTEKKSKLLAAGSPHDLELGIYPGGVFRLTEIILLRLG
jgi:hypothetical protein